MCIRSDVSKFVDKISITHKRKLEDVGIKNSLSPCDPNQVIFNLSSKPLPSRIRYLLAFGLEFSIPPLSKLKFETFMLPFEKLAAMLSKQCISTNINFSKIRKELSYIAYKYFYGFSPKKIFSPIFSKRDLDLLRKFSSDKSIIVCKPDKGRGVVILDKKKYDEDMEKILDD